MRCLGWDLLRACWAVPPAEYCCVGHQHALAIVHVLACAWSFFGVLGLAGLYARQAAKTGWLGLIGYLLLSFWLVLIMGFSFVEAFILPHMATQLPGLRCSLDGNAHRP